MKSVEPWPEPVNGAALLSAILALFGCYVVAPTNHLIASALFVVHTYAFDLRGVSPVLYITGPTKRCGKSRFLSLFQRLVNRPLIASSATPAAIYRLIESHQPTLLLDEVETFLKGNEQLRGLINSGHTRDAAYHLGCVAKGLSFDVRSWSTWTPKIFSGIGRLADTIEDRAVIIRMTRRRKDQPIERLRYDVQFEELRRKAARFVSDNKEAIRSAEPVIPQGLDDRAADNWEPLFALADLAGDKWPATARQAALELSGERTQANLELLSDVKRAFEESKADRLFSRNICERLAKIQGAQWSKFGKRSTPISPAQFANELHDFGVLPRNIRIGIVTGKGYYLEDFERAFEENLTDLGGWVGNTATSSASIGETLIPNAATVVSCDATQKPTVASDSTGCGVVAAGTTMSQEEVWYV